MLHEITGGPADVPGDACGFVNEAVAAETHRDHPIVVRPNRAVLVGIRIIGGIVCGKCPDAPAAPPVRFHEPLDHLGGAVGGHDARPQALVAGIGSNAQYLLFVAIETESVEAGLFMQERVVEVDEQGLGLFTQSLGTS